MSTEEFVKNFHDQKNKILQSYLNDNETTVSQKINSLNLTADQSKLVKSILDDVLTDAIYSVLLGLSGSSSIGNTQTEYKISDEKGNEIDNDEIEEHAWSYFQ